MEYVNKDMVDEFNFNVTDIPGADPVIKTYDGIRSSQQTKYAADKYTTLLYQSVRAILSTNAYFCFLWKKRIFKHTRILRFTANYKISIGLSHNPINFATCLASSMP